MAKKNEDSGKDESTMGYFRRLFQENPKLLKSKSNADIFSKWLEDHPGEKEVPKKVRQSLSNTKSVLRSKSRRRKPKNGQEVQEVQPALKIQNRKLEKLEEIIDECLNEARSLDREALESVIQHLRRARNEVVWKMEK